MTDDPMSIAEGMSHGEVKLFMSTTASINGLYGWGFIVRRYSMRFVVAFTQSHYIYTQQRLSDAAQWSGWTQTEDTVMMIPLAA